MKTRNVDPELALQERGGCAAWVVFHLFACVSAIFGWVAERLRPSSLLLALLLCGCHKELPKRVIYGTNTYRNLPTNEWFDYSSFAETNDESNTHFIMVTWFIRFESNTVGRVINLDVPPVFGKKF